jgi:NAD(P)-dependent dehydrogenase (short-subunit alcohol dehydrogenase family)
MLLAQNKVIVITGASAGLGRALATESARRGARVVLLARRKNVLEGLRNSISDNGGNVIAFPIDIGTPDSVIKAFSMIESRWGRIDILFNVAAVVEPVKRLEHISNAELETSLHTNVLGLYLVTRETLKRMLAKREGTIINITSSAAQRPYVGWSNYCSQKAAVDMFTKTVALEVEHKLIRVAAISPGPFESRMQEVIRNSAEYQFPSKEKFVRLHKTGKLPGPDVIAPVLLDISFTDWPELSGMVTDIRSEKFQIQCQKHGVVFPEKIIKKNLTV